MTGPLSRRSVLGGAVAMPISVWLAACSSSAPSGKALPRPSALLRTRWSTDPWSRGAGSYLPLGTDSGARTALAAPLDSLFFAGEATASTGANTFAGAIVSGRHAATEVLERGLGTTSRVVIIGAGASGLATAAEFVSAGVTPTVLEAREVVGGRVRSDSSLGVPVSLGPSASIEPSTGAVMAPLAAQLGTTMVAVPSDLVLRDLHGHRHDAQRVVDALVDALVSIDAGVGVRNELAGELQRELAGLDPREFAWATARLELLLGAPATEVDVSALAESGDLDTTMRSASPRGLVKPVGGLLALLEPLTVGVDLRTNTVVTSVLWSRSRSAVMTSSPDGTEVEVPFDALVITLPLGVLQAGTVIFDPPLPVSKQAAIDQLGVGVVDKLVLQFDEVFWDDAAVIGALGPTPGEWTKWDNLEPSTGRPILVGHNAATVARTLVPRTDEQLVTSALSTLRSLYD